MDVLRVVELLTQFVTFFMLVSGFPPCLEMVKRKDTRNVPYIFFLLSLLNGLSGVYYGQLVNISALISVNIVAVICNGLYIAMYIIASKSKGLPFIKAMLMIVIHYIVCFYINSQGFSESTVIDKLGKFLFFVCVLLLASPFLEVLQCFSEKSSEGLSISMLVGGTFCCVAWLVYGLMLQDFYIYAPNIIGMAANIGKIVALAVFPRQKAKTA